MSIKKISAALTALAIGVSMAGSALAAGNGTDHLGPFAGSSPDGGSCGSSWANDTYNISFNVHNNGDGTFAVRTEYKDGSFVTTGPVSPGACETANHHGTNVAPGITGDFQGFVDEAVTSATYNPAACNTPGVCTTRSGFIAAVFPGATESFSGFNFEYNSNDTTLAYRHWQDKSGNAGNDKFEGDIAN